MSALKLHERVRTARAAFAWPEILGGGIAQANGEEQLGDDG
jgi:hypothetical protein